MFKKHFLCATSIGVVLAGCSSTSAEPSNDEGTGYSDSALSVLPNNCYGGLVQDQWNCYAQVCGSGLDEGEPCSKCDAAYNTALAQCQQQGTMTIYRGYWTPPFPYNLFGRHLESLLKPEISQRQRGTGVVEGGFRLSAEPVPGGGPALYRCWYPVLVAGKLDCRDFLSASPSCEGAPSCQVTAARPSFHGAGFPPGTPGARLMYRCRIGNDHFLSWDPKCEGQVVEGPLGYAIPSN